MWYNIDRKGVTAMAYDSKKLYLVRKCLLESLQEEILLEIKYVQRKYGNDPEYSKYFEGRIDGLDYILQIVEEALHEK